MKTLSHSRPLSRNEILDAIDAVDLPGEWDLNYTLRFDRKTVLFELEIFTPEGTGATNAEILKLGVVTKESFTRVIDRLINDARPRRPEFALAQVYRFPASIN